MTRLARRNKTRWIKRTKARGCRYIGGSLWVNLGRWKLEAGVTVDGFPYGDGYNATTLPKEDWVDWSEPGMTVEFPPVPRSDPCSDRLRARQRRMAEQVIGPMVARVLGELGIER